MSRHHAPMRTKRWAAFRRSLIDRAGWRCEKCGRPGRLEIHHPHELQHGGDIWDERNCRVWCRRCHLDEHRRPDTPEARRWDRLIEKLR